MKAIKKYLVVTEVSGTQNLNELSNRFMRQLKEQNLRLGSTAIRVCRVQNFGQENDIISGEELKNFNIDYDAEEKDRTDSVKECLEMDDDLQGIKKKLKTIKELE